MLCTVVMVRPDRGKLKSDGLAALIHMIAFFWLLVGKGCMRTLVDIEKVDVFEPIPGHKRHVTIPSDETVDGFH